MNRNGICYLVCAGEKSSLDFSLKEEDLLISVDGGQRYIEEKGSSADIALGDFDSIDRTPKAKEILKLNPIKDVTDTFYAVNIAIERGYRIIRIYCALGGRFSHTMANIQTLNYLSEKGIDAQIIGDGVKLYICKTKAEIDEGGMLSLFPISEKAEVSIRNCKYSGDFVLTKTDSLGVSNEPNKNATVTVNDGVVLIVIEKN